jgi:hypothetical protein
MLLSLGCYVFQKEDISSLALSRPRGRISKSEVKKLFIDAYILVHHTSPH